jgi:hypothetical protein
MSPHSFRSRNQRGILAELFPLKIKAASAGCCRVVAIFEDSFYNSMHALALRRNGMLSQYRLGE